MKSQTKFHLAFKLAYNHFGVFHMVSNAGGIENNKTILNISKNIMQENIFLMVWSQVWGYESFDSDLFLRDSLYKLFK